MATGPKSRVPLGIDGLLIDTKVALSEKPIPFTRGVSFVP